MEYTTFERAQHIDRTSRKLYLLTHSYALGSGQVSLSQEECFVLRGPAKGFAAEHEARRRAPRFHRRVSYLLPC